VGEVVKRLLGAVLTGGKDGSRPPDESFVAGRPAATTSVGDVAAGLWPGWARVQLEQAAHLASAVDERTSLAGLLYSDWFTAVAGEVERPSRPLGGLYRAAHAGSSRRIRRAGISVVERHDALRDGGWWRTWGEDWTPPRTRRGSVRLLFTPRPDRLADFVSIVTGRLIDHDSDRWSFACSTDARRIARRGSAVLDLPGFECVPTGLLDELAAVLRPVVPPLCLPLSDGVGGAEYPDNGMTFGEHRCHLVALALRHPSAAHDPLRKLAAVFNAHGIDPQHPYRISES
jgi:hypothetical protein